jgi:hypothetical protein
LDQSHWMTWWGWQENKLAVCRIKKICVDGIINNRNKLLLHYVLFLYIFYMKDYNYYYYWQIHLFLLFIDILCRFSHYHHAMADHAYIPGIKTKRRKITLIGACSLGYQVTPNLLNAITNWRSK